MEMKTKVVGGIMVALQAVTLSVAKLDRVSPEDLVRESTLIILAHSTEAQLDTHRAGHTVLTVEQRVVGQYSGATIRLDWTGREDEEPIREVGRDYLLFLHKVSDRYVAAITGVSHWPVGASLHAERVIEFVYPVTMVDVPEGFITSVPSPFPEERRKGCTIEMISLPNFIKWVRAKKGETG